MGLGFSRRRVKRVDPCDDPDGACAKEAPQPRCETASPGDAVAEVPRPAAAEEVANVESASTGEPSIASVLSSSDKAPRVSSDDGVAEGADVAAEAPAVGAAAEGAPGAAAEEQADHAGATGRLVAAVEAEEWDEAAQILRSPEPCDANARTADWGYSVLRASAEEGRTQICRLLLERRAEVNARDQNGMTPLMGCIVGGDFGDLVSLLLEAKADATAQTDDGFTALKWATRLDREQAIVLLREAGMTGATTCF